MRLMCTEFVLLVHSGHGPLHYDLMLEHGSALATWQFLANPVAWRAAAGQAGQAASGGRENKLMAERIQDHRLAYLDYEGPVSGGRGSVRRIDKGRYELLAESPDRLTIRLAGAHLAGEFELVRVPPAGQWQFRPA